MRGEGEWHRLRARVLRVWHAAFIFIVARREEWRESVSADEADREEARRRGEKWRPRACENRTDILTYEAALAGDALRRKSISLFGGKSAPKGMMTMAHLGPSLCRLRRRCAQGYPPI